MKDGAKPKFLQDRVAYYVTGEEAWRYAPTLDAVTGQRESWYLDSVASRANDVFASGDLRRDGAGRGEADRYVHDPRDTSSAEWESEDNEAGLVDQRGALQAAGKALFYHTPPFAKDTDIAGRFRLSAWISLDQPDTDIFAVVHEVRPDGGVVYLASDAIRARYRKDLRNAERVEPGAIERYDFDDFAFNARRIGKGSRLRLMVGPVNSMYAEKNWNAGGVVATESAKDARTVTVTLYHDAQHPRELSVPLAAPSSVAVK
jgi:hypothetical protein